MFQKKLLLLAVLICFFAYSRAQVDVYQTHQDHNHYSIVQIGTDHILGGTTYTGNTIDPTNINLFRTDQNGHLLWEKTYDFGLGERCFDISPLEEKNFGLTGYVEIDGEKRILVAKFDDHGNLLEQKILSQGIHGEKDQTGLEMMYSVEANAYFLSGFGIANGVIQQQYGDARENHGILVKLDLNFQVLKATNLRGCGGTFGINYMQNTISDMVDIPGYGVFLTGSVCSLGGGSQAMMAYMVDYNLFPRWNKSAIVTSDLNRGADAVYYEAEDRLYLLNITENDEPGSETELFRIDEVKSPSPIMQHLGVIETGLGKVGMRGLSLEKGIDGHLAIGGLMRKSNVSSTVTDNSPTFLTFFDRTTETFFGSHFYLTSNFNYREQDGGYLSGQWGFHNSATPRMLAFDDELGQYALLGYSKPVGNAIYDLNLFTADANGVADPDCSIPFSPDLREPEPLISQAAGLQENWPVAMSTEEIPEVLLLQSPNEECVSIGSDCFVEASFTRAYTDCYTWDFFSAYNIPPGAVVLSYHWDFGDGTTSSLADPSHTFGQDCEETVCLTITIQNSLGAICSSQFCEIFRPKGSGSQCSPCHDLGGLKKELSEEFTATSMVIFPNPAHSTFVLQNVEAKEGSTRLMLTDIQGKVLMQLTQSQAHFGEPVDINHLAPGVYFLTGKIGEQMIHERVVVQ